MADTQLVIMADICHIAAILGGSFSYSILLSFDKLKYWKIQLPVSIARTGHSYQLIKSGLKYPRLLN